MRDTTNAVKVGVLVLLTLGASYAVYRLVDEGSGSGDDYGVYGLFTNAQGLVQKSRVLIAGIPIGTIDTIRLEGAQARVDVRIEEGVTLYDDATVRKESASILGESVLVIHPGTPGRPELEDGSRLTVLESAPGTDEILRSVGETARSVERVAAQVERVFGTDRGGDQMASALENLSEALEAINRTIQQNEQVIARTLENIESTTATAGPELVEILDNLNQISADVRHIIGENRDGLTEAGGDVTETAAALNRSSERLERVMEDIEDITDRTARGEGTIGRLTSDEALIDEVEGVVEDVGDIVGPINRLQTIVGLRSEYNFLANTFKNYVSIYLQPREDRYYLIELIDDPRGLTEFTQTTVRRSPPPDGEPATYQETRIETSEAFRFSLLFGKRVYFATFRFGLIESTGGIGIDLHLFDDHLELSTDLFAFGDQAFPRLRTRLAYEVVSHLWILGGVDDTLNDSRDFFLGAMLRFNDEDLKSILPFASGVGTGGT
jgi:phospholipid/cholesterol/gamma-HCH transport system substrate-binding protein